MPRQIKKLGWKPDLPDHRDYRFSTPVEIRHLPESVDLRPNLPAVYDQGDLGSCVANAVAALIQFDQLKQGLPSWNPSRLFIYYGAREIEGSIREDSGCQIRDGIKVVSSLGVCREVPTWPYDPEQFATKPNEEAYREALDEVAVRYFRLPYSSLQFKACLAKGYPFAFGFSVYEKFMSSEVADTGILNLPEPGESLLGGHAVVCVGYDSATASFLIRNSWGTAFGQGGHFWMPESYLTNSALSSDFWTIRLIR